MRLGSQTGFTLIEIMVVVVILGILAAVVAVNVSGRTDIAAANATRVLLKELRGQVEAFRMDHGRYPEELDHLTDPPPSYVDPTKWPPGGYFDPPILDGWKRPLLFLRPGSGTRRFEIVSLGADGQEGGTGVAADLSSHFSAH